MRETESELVGGTYVDVVLRLVICGAEIIVSPQAPRVIDAVLCPACYCATEFSGVSAVESGTVGRYRGIVAINILMEGNFSVQGGLFGELIADATTQHKAQVLHSLGLVGTCCIGILCIVLSPDKAIYGCAVVERAVVGGAGIQLKIVLSPISGDA